MSGPRAGRAELAEFDARLAGLRRDLSGQATLASALLTDAFEALFDGDVAMARSVISRDDEVDRVDVRIEREAVTLLTRAVSQQLPLGEPDLRSVLTVVKVNNELERIADGAVSVAERAVAIHTRPVTRPPEWPATTRVMTNSVLGMMRDASSALARLDPELARIVLQSERAVEQFKRTIVLKAEEGLAAGRLPIEAAFDLGEIAGLCTLVADHACNVAEQVIYERTGAIVRHTDSGQIHLTNLE